MAHDTLHFPILKDLGLSDSEAIVYELLLELGPKKASDLVEPAGIGRGNVYNMLTQLHGKQLVTVKEGKRQIYEAVDPSHLRSLLEFKLEEARRLESSFASALPHLASTFNLSTGKPTIQVFEGIEGFRTALADSLEAKTEILTYIDPDALTGPFVDINKQYVRLRVKKAISKRIIMPDTPTAHAYAKNMTVEFTEILLVSNLAEHFSTAMELYNDVVTYLTLRQEKTIAVIMQDPHIAALQRAQFEYIWKTGLANGAPHFVFRSDAPDESARSKTT